MRSPPRAAVSYADGHLSLFELAIRVVVSAAFATSASAALASAAFKLAVAPPVHPLFALLRRHVFHPLADSVLNVLRETLHSGGHLHPAGSAGSGLWRSSRSRLAGLATLGGGLQERRALVQRRQLEIVALRDHLLAARNVDGEHAVADLSDLAAYEGIAFTKVLA